MLRRTLLIFFIVSLYGCNFIVYKNTENAKTAEINAQLALHYLTNKNPAFGKSKLLLAQKQAPSDPAIWYMSGYFWEHAGNVATAEKDYLKAISLAPDSGSAQNNYGVFLCRQEKYAAAISHFDLAASDPNYLYPAEAYKNAASCALKIPNKPLARKYFSLAKGH